MKLTNASNQKGFIFVELIIVTTMLMVGLMVLYKQFSSSISYQKQKLIYQNIADNYKLYYMAKELIEQDEYPACVSTSKETNCYSLAEALNLLKTVKSGTTSYAKTDLNIKKIDGDVLKYTYNTFNTSEYLITLCQNYTQYTSSDSIYQIKNEIKDTDLKDEFKSYIKTIKGCNNMENIRFIAGFKNEITKRMSYSTFEYPN